MRTDLSVMFLVSIYFVSELMMCVTKSLSILKSYLIDLKRKSYFLTKVIFSQSFSEIIIVNLSDTEISFKNWTILFTEFDVTGLIVTAISRSLHSAIWAILLCEFTVIPFSLMIFMSISILILRFSITQASWWSLTTSFSDLKSRNRSNLTYSLHV